MKNVLATLIAMTMVSSVTLAGTLGQMSDDSSKASTASKNLVSGSLQFSVNQVEAFSNWSGPHLNAALVSSEAKIVSAYKLSEDSVKVTLELASDSGILLADLVVASANTSAQAITAAYQEGRKVNVTIVNPAAIDRAAKGSLGQKALGVSGQSINKASEALASVAVSVAASSAQIVISPVTYTQELRSVRQSR